MCTEKRAQAAEKYAHFVQIIPNLVAHRQLKAVFGTHKLYNFGVVW